MQVASAVLKIMNSKRINLTVLTSIKNDIKVAAGMQLLRCMYENSPCST